MDDLSIRRVLSAVAPFVPRNYIVMEVKENLCKDDRASNLKRFSNPLYKKVAHVCMGEPTADYKKVVHERILKRKQDKALHEWKGRRAEKERKKAAAARTKQLAIMRQKAEEQRKKAEAERKAKLEEAAKKKKEEAEKKKKEAEEKKKAEEEGADGEKKDADEKAEGAED